MTQRGQDLAEYALLTSVLALFVMGALMLWGEAIRDFILASVEFVNTWIDSVEASTAALQALNTQMAELSATATATGVIP